MNTVDFRPCFDSCHTSKVRVGMLLGSVSVSSGGVSEAVRSLALALRRIPAISVDIFSLDEPGTERRDFGDIPVHFARRYGSRSFGYAPDLGHLLNQHPVDLLHVHGLWMYRSIVARQWGARTGRPYIVSPHGVLDRGRWATCIGRSASRGGCSRTLICAARNFSMRFAKPSVPPSRQRK